MSIIKSLAAAAAFVISASFVPAQAQEVRQSTWDRIMQTKVLRVGVAPGEPWAMRDASSSELPGGVKVGGEVWRGVAPAMGKTLADTLGVQLQFVETTWGNAVSGLQANQFDVWFVMEPTPKRAMAIDFVPTTLLWHAMSFFSIKPLPVKTWAELNDPKYRVGVVVGVATDIFATAEVPKSKITRFQDIDQQIAALQAGRIDAAVMLSPVASSAYAKLKTGNVVIPKPIKAYPSSVSIPREADTRWKNFLTTSVSYLYDTGEVQEMFSQHMKFRGVDAATLPSMQRENW